MDKKLNRVIGYIPNKQPGDSQQVTKPGAIESKQVSEIAELPDYEKMQIQKSKKIVDWILEHPEFKWGAMCKKVGLDKGNFKRTLAAKTPKIKISFIPPVETFLNKYGYVK